MSDNQLPPAFDFSQPVQRTADAWYSPEQLARIAERKRILDALHADPEIEAYKRSCKYPFIAEAIINNPDEHGVYIRNVEDLRARYIPKEAENDRAMEEFLNPKPKGKPADAVSWEERQKLWSQQREQREAEAAAKRAERDAKKQRKAELQVQLDAARQVWKDAIQRKAELMRDCDAEIRVLHEAFTELKRQADSL